MPPPPPGPRARNELVRLRAETEQMRTEAAAEREQIRQDLRGRAARAEDEAARLREELAQLRSAGRRNQAARPGPPQRRPAASATGHERPRRPRPGAAHRRGTDIDGRDGSSLAGRLACPAEPGRRVIDQDTARAAADALAVLFQDSPPADPSTARRVPGTSRRLPGPAAGCEPMF